MAGKTRRATFQAPGDELFARYAGIRDRAERCIRFIEAECLVPEGRGTGKPYRLRPYQKRTIRKLLAKGTLVAVLSAPRGWTKSGLAAAIAVWALYDREAAQVLVCSTSMRTAKIIYRRAVRIIELNPELDDHAQIYRNAAEPFEICPACFYRKDEGENDGGPVPEPAWTDADAVPGSACAVAVETTGEATDSGEPTTS